MGITETQRLRRSENIGSSDMAAIMGLSPYASSYDVYLNKVYPTKGISSEAMDIGTHLEQGIINYCETKIGKILPNQYRRVAGTKMAANIDGLALDDGNKPCEFKTAGILSSFARGISDWGDAGTPDVPDHVAIQCHVHMLALTANVESMSGYPEYCHVGALIGGRGIVMFKVPFDRELAEHMVRVADEFWVGHVEPRIPPRDVSPSLGTIKTITRIPNKVVMGGDDILTSWETRKALKDEEKYAHDAAKVKQAEILAQLGDAEAIKLPDGSMITYFTSSRTVFQSARFQADHPEMYNEYTGKTTYPTIRYKTPKATAALEKKVHLTFEVKGKAE